mgnify:CR=1 FL=1
MASRSKSAWAVGSLLAFAAVFTLTEGGAPTPKLDAAEEPSLFVDSDGDFLPDGIEWTLGFDALIADADGDGVGDFVQATQHRFPGVSSEQSEHNLRAVVTILSEPGRDSAWLHLLFSFPGNDFQRMRLIAPWVDYLGQRLPIPLVPEATRFEYQAVHRPQDGLMVRYSFELGREDVLHRVLPCTIGATVVFEGQTDRSGHYLLKADGRSAAWEAVSARGGVIRTLNVGDTGDPFWSSSRLCLMQLSTVGVTRGGTLCLVTNATCTPDNRLTCPPTCSQSLGQTMFFPDGMSTVTGTSASDH